MSDNVKLLLVDDDQELCDLMGQYLQSEGFEVSFAHSAEQALPLLQQDGAYDLLIFDIMMPGQTGLELLQQVRPRVKTPVIMLTGRGDDIDRIIGLEMGADDYLGKPCNPRELVARIRAVLRRSGQTVGPEETATVLSLHNIELDPGKRRVQVAGNEIELTSAEFNVLAELMQSVGSIVSKDELTEKVLHRKLTAYDRAIDVHVSRVRQKLAAVMPGSELIKTVRGAGYMLVNE
ncbi:response regulator transcription factor [Amphritea sp. 2_MG-2023]|uniref:response regulator transcription factor n=1 Tax=Amphritea TaxID=515417 RepID=UPI001C078456|nr:MULTISPECIES: response regulator transcription factor [Amphritea]MBU2964747.1 response regulator transcription factor [Amphritea atlantica]MDO6417144.1 response regulator transcription factor [Amphritea sp. 2_MG-2023]